MNKKYHEKKLDEQRKAETLKQRADIDYIAMMSDIDLPSDAREEESGNE